MYSRLQQNNPGDGPGRPARAYPGFWGAVLLLAILLFIALFLSLVSIALFEPVKARDLMGSRTVGRPGEFILWLTAIGNTLAFTAVILIAKFYGRRPWNELAPVTLKIRNFSSYLLPLALLSLGLSIIFSEVDNVVRFFFPAPDWITEMMMEVASNGLASFTALVIVAPLTEEIFFRGVVLGGFLRRYSPAAAIILSAFLFAVTHINPYQMISAFGIGLVFAWIRILSGSLWPSIYMHALANGSILFVTSIGLDIPGYSVGDGGQQFQPLWLDGMGLILFGYGLKLSYKIFYGQPGEIAEDIQPEGPLK